MKVWLNKVKILSNIVIDYETIKHNENREDLNHDSSTLLPNTEKTSDDRLNSPRQYSTFSPSYLQRIIIYFFIPNKNLSLEPDFII